MSGNEISYTEAQSNLGVLLDRVADNKDIIIVKRDGTDKNVALIAETDLSSLLETVYLLRSSAFLTSRNPQVKLLYHQQTYLKSSVSCQSSRLHHNQS